MTTKNQCLLLFRWPCASVSTYPMRRKRNELMMEFSISPVTAFRHSVNPVYYYHGDLVCTKWTQPTWGEVGSDSDRVDQNAHCSGWVQWNVLVSMYFIFDFCTVVNVEAGLMFCSPPWLLSFYWVFFCILGIYLFCEKKCIYEEMYLFHRM